MVEPSTYSKISIVTPSFNHGAFLSQTIDSVLNQQYPSLEYIAIDGGSTDESAAIIKSYENQLAYHVSEKDDGQYNAINKGFEKSTGEIMGWLNSDDMYLPWTLRTVAKVFETFPDVQWISTMSPLTISAESLAVSCGYIEAFSKREFRVGGNLPSRFRHARSFIQQEATFWRRSLWEKAGGRLDESFSLAGDFELWSRFYQHADLFGVEFPLAAFRHHGNQRSVEHAKAYTDEAARVLKRDGRVPSGIESLIRAGVLLLSPRRLCRLLADHGLKPFARTYIAYDFEKLQWVFRRV